MQKDRVKVAFLGPAPPFRGGISAFAEALASSIASMGYETRHYSMQKQYPDFLFPGSGQYEDKCSALPVERVFTPYLPYTWQLAVKRIQIFNPQVLFLSYWIPFFAPAYIWIIGALKKKDPKLQVLLVIHNIRFHERWLFSQSLSKALLDKCDKLLVLSQQSYQDLMSALPFTPPNKLIQGFHPPYTTFPQRPVQKLTDGVFELLFFGFIKPYKGLDVLLQALPLVIAKLPQTRLTIAGDVYKDREKIIAQIKALGLAKHINLQLRYIAESEVSDFFGSANVCVLPYKSATQSGIISLAQAFCLPVIASDVGGISEAIDGSNGMLVPPQDPTALAEAIVIFFVEEREHRYRKALQDQLSKNTWSNLAKLTMEKVCPAYS